MSQPIIGIVSNSEYVEKGFYKKRIHDVNDDYLNMIYKYGGVPVIIPNTSNFELLKPILNDIDALLLIGGEDISKNCYFGKNSENSRDNLEIDLYKFFKKNRKPILGICRGLQIINVAEGGTLKNVDNNSIIHGIGNDGWINYHDINILPNTQLEEILSRNNYVISSVHHQAIDKLGKEVKVSALSPDEVIEAIENFDNNGFMIAFQGHIEKCLDNYNEYEKVIKKFIGEAKR